MKREMMLPKLKIWEVDYSFIVRNYLNPEMWKKSWNLFEYRNYAFKISIININTEDMAIKFRIKSNKHYNYTTFDYYLNNMSIDFLKNQINLKIYYLIEELEKSEIKDSEAYDYIRQGGDREEKLLIQIAEEFLDENNVTHKDIRDVYIDYYVSEHGTLIDELDEYVKQRKYLVLTDLWLVFANSIKDLEKAKLIENSLNVDEEYLQNVRQEIEEYMQYLETDEAVDNFRDKLEAI